MMTSCDSEQQQGFILYVRAWVWNMMIFERAAHLSLAVNLYTSLHRQSGKHSNNNSIKLGCQGT